MVGLPSRGIKSGVSVRCGCWCFCSHSARSVGSQSQFLHEREEARQHQVTHTRAARARRHLLDKVVGLADIDKLAIDTNTHAGLRTRGIRLSATSLRAAAQGRRSACARTHELRQRDPWLPDDDGLSGSHGCLTAPTAGIGSGRQRLEATRPTPPPLPRSLGLLPYAKASAEGARSVSAEASQKQIHETDGCIEIGFWFVDVAQTYSFVRPSKLF